MERDFREVVQSWLDGNFDEATKAQIIALQENDPVGLEDAFYRNLEFGTGGLRGIMGVGTNRMNKYTVGMATQGLANYMKANCEGPLSVCISFDSRNNSPEFAQIAANVLAANGIHVYIFDKLHPIALMSYLVRKHRNCKQRISRFILHNLIKCLTEILYHFRSFPRRNRIKSYILISF